MGLYTAFSLGALVGAAATLLGVVLLAMHFETQRRKALVEEAFSRFRQRMCARELAELTASFERSSSTLGRGAAS